MNEALDRRLTEDLYGAPEHQLKSAVYLPEPHVHDWMPSNYEPGAPHWTWWRCARFRPTWTGEPCRMRHIGVYETLPREPLYPDASEAAEIPACAVCQDDLDADLRCQNCGAA